MLDGTIGQLGWLTEIRVYASISILRGKVEPMSRKKRRSRARSLRELFVVAWQQRACGRIEERKEEYRHCGSYCRNNNAIVVLNAECGLPFSIMHKLQASLRVSMLIMGLMRHTVQYEIWLLVHADPTHETLKNIEAAS